MLMDGKIIMNEIVWDSQKIREFISIYKIPPAPGNYWYDSKSGLYGLTGQPGSGFLYAGHDFGIVALKASNGNTGVVFNGRELPQEEWLLLCQIIANTIWPGHYWLDAQGNAGMEGNSIPLINLFMAIQNNFHQQKSNGGDNFWSTRFSAGNSTANGSAGYVSVPGYGPVGYGIG